MAAGADRAGYGVKGMGWFVFIVKWLLEKIFGKDSKAAQHAGLIAVFLAFIGVLLIIGGIGAAFQSCGSRRAAEKDKENQEQILRDKIQIENLGEQRNVQLTNNNQAARASEAANANFNAVLRTDTNSRDGDFGAVRRKFCEDHPNDSKCR